MTILGISESHEAHACIVRDGDLIAVVAEERLSRCKSDEGYPRRAVEAVLRMTGIDSRDLDCIALAGLHPNPIPRILRRVPSFSIRDWVQYQHSYWKPKLIGGQSLTDLDGLEQSKHVHSASLASNPYFPYLARVRGRSVHEHQAIFDALRREVIREHLGVSDEKIRCYRHEDCHKAYAHMSSPFASDPALVFTMEGGGDDSSATVSTSTSKGVVEHWKSNAVHLGRLYANVTLILGMKPVQHEYKVMGLAPYGTEYHGKRSLEFFRTINAVVGTEIHDTKTIRDLYFSVRDALEGERFDGIAWGLQEYLEEVLCTWVRNNVVAHGIDRVVFSGGVAQNIKACKRLRELPEVAMLWVPPIAGDGSIAIGAAWLASRQLTPAAPIRRFETVYLGTEYGSVAINEALAQHDLREQFDVVEGPSPADVAAWLDDGYIIARFSGRMEFGQRALGNRSILADPRRVESVERINEKIKYRDFWMPFTPSILAEDVDRFIENPKSAHSPYMAMAFNTKPGVAREIPAVIHPADKTTRPQMLRREDNPGYYDLIAAFKARTGIGVVLNTSFNLHGDAIVESPEDAIQTFLKSDLDVLLFDHIAIGRVPLRAGKSAMTAAVAPTVASVAT